MKTLQLDLDQVWVWLTGSSCLQQLNLMEHVHWCQQENKQVQKCKSSLEKFCSSSKPVYLCLCVWELVQSGNVSPYIFFSLCPAEPNSGSSRQPSPLPSGESWAGGTCTDPFYPKEMSAWEPCLLHKSRQGYSDRLRRRQEGNVPSAEPFQDIPGLRGCLCSQGTLAFMPCFSGRTADDDKSSSRWNIPAPLV